MTDVERLLAVEEIKKLKARYFRCMDTKQWAEWQKVFTTNAVLDAGDERPPIPKITGSDKIVSFVSKTLESVVTVHHGHMPEIEVTSDTTARGVWSMEDKLQWPDGKTSLHGYGHYHESYENVGGKWLISTVKLTRLRTDRT